MPVPELKAFDCIDHDPIEEWHPESVSDLYYTLCLHIGIAGRDGADLFYVDVMSPQVEQTLGPKLRSRSIVIDPYSWNGVLAKVEIILAQCEGQTWDDQARLLSAHFHWEFENYQFYQP
jgi:hypothetical protein